MRRTANGHVAGGYRRPTKCTVEMHVKVELQFYEEGDPPNFRVVEWSAPNCNFGRKCARNASNLAEMLLICVKSGFQGI